MIDPNIWKQLCEIGTGNGKIHQIILFGSRAVGDHADRSDIDIAFVAPTMTPEEWAAFTFDVEDELDTLLLLDLVKFEDVSAHMKNEIIETGKTIYKKGKDEGDSFESTSH